MIDNDERTLALLDLAQMLAEGKIDEQRYLATAEAIPSPAADQPPGK